MKTSNEFLRLVSSPMMNATNIYRYSGMKLIESENLAEHTYETIMLGYLIIGQINSLYPEDKIDINLYMHKALHHDLEESMTGDVARPLKYHNQDVKRELNKVATQIAESMYEEYFSDTEFEEYWVNAKCGVEGAILKVVDMLVVVFKAIREVRILNNMYFMRVVKEVLSYLHESRVALARVDSISDNVKTYLLTVIDEAYTEMDDLYKEFKPSIRSLGITDRSMIEREDD